MTKRIGFACKWSAVNNKNEVISVDGFNTGTTTHAWTIRNPRNKVEDKLIELAKRNITNTHRLLKHLATLPPELRMMRVTSDMLPLYTHSDFTDFWKQSDVQLMLERDFAAIGETAKINDIRLSFHPGQFTVLASENDDIVEKSIEEVEYHADMAKWMGYGKSFQDFKINIHISGRRGPDGIRAVLPRLSPEARNTLTIENDEMSWGTDASLELANEVALVLDIHHHWVKTGEYIESTSDTVKKIADSWRGCRPVIHYSVSREDVLVDHCDRTLPDHNYLLETGHKKQKLRAHSEYYWNHAVNDWAMSHYEWADILCESKAKNLASFQLYDRYVKKG